MATIVPLDPVKSRLCRRPAAVLPGSVRPSGGGARVLDIDPQAAVGRRPRASAGSQSRQAICRRDLLWMTRIGQSKMGGAVPVHACVRTMCSNNHHEPGIGAEGIGLREGTGR
jgi:hypothetical protein